MQYVCGTFLIKSARMFAGHERLVLRRRWAPHFFCRPLRERHGVGFAALKRDRRTGLVQRVFRRRGRISGQVTDRAGARDVPVDRNQRCMSAQGSAAVPDARRRPFRTRSASSLTSAAPAEDRGGSPSAFSAEKSPSGLHFGLRRAHCASAHPRRPAERALRKPGTAAMYARIQILTAAVSVKRNFPKMSFRAGSAACEKARKYRNAGILPLPECHCPARYANSRFGKRPWTLRFENWCLAGPKMFFRPLADAGRACRLTETSQSAPSRQLLWSLPDMAHCSSSAVSSPGGSRRPHSIRTARENWL